MNTGKFRVQDQVVVKQKLLRQQGMSAIKIGRIMAFREARDKVLAVVSIPSSNTRKEIPIGELELVSERFKRTVVQENPAFRSIGYLR